MNNDNAVDMLLKENKEIKLIVNELRKEVNMVRNDINQIKKSLKIEDKSNSDELNEMINDDNNNKDDPLGFRLS